MNDNNPQMQVYYLPVRLHVECHLYILASGQEAAQKAASIVDLQDYFTFDRSSVHTDGDNLLRVEDVITFPIDAAVIPITPIPPEEYPPHTHPDFSGESKK